MRRSFEDFILGYLVKHKAPDRITYSSKGETRVFGFWVYLPEKGDLYSIKERIDVLTYDCIKVDAGAEESETTFTKKVGEDGIPFRDVNVVLFYKSVQIRDLSPVKAFIYGMTGIYRVVAWREDAKYRRAIKNNRKAYFQYRERLRLLQLLIDIRNRQSEGEKPRAIFPDKDK